MPPLWSVLLVVFLALLVGGTIIAAIILLGGNRIPANTAEPVVVMISAVPSETPELSDLFEITPTPNFTSSGATPAQSVALTGPTLIPTPTITPTLITIVPGATVIIISPGGVRVRSEPGTSTRVNFVANFNETFTVVDGPQQVDDLTWWQIEDPDNSGRSGWAAENDGLSDLMQVFVP